MTCRSINLPLESHVVILGIETSCDETAAGIVDADGRLHANVVASQANIHAEYGGVVPEVASRQHIRDIEAVVNAALKDAGCGWSDLDAVAATNGPGLAGSLLVGVNFAKGAALASGKRFVAVNHLVGHVMAAFIKPAAGTASGEVSADSRHDGIGASHSKLMALIVSGGHTELVVTEGSVSGGFQFKLVGETRDDAAGEAFDKAARTLGLGYPGGPAIQNAAEGATYTGSFKLPRAWLGGASEFSFSGLKTAVIQMARRHGIDGAAIGPGGDDERRHKVAAIAYEFQQSVVDVLVAKTLRAASAHGCEAVALVGGVAANRPLRTRLVEESPLPVLVPPISLCTDNGAMIAMAGLLRLLEPGESEFDAEVIPSLRIG